MASSPVQIANRALARLGLRATIASFDEQSAEAGYAKAFYGPMLAETLALLDWRFATKYQALAPTGTAPQPWAGQFMLPSDCLTVRAMAETQQAPQQPCWHWPAECWVREPRFATGLGQDSAGNPVRVIWCDMTAPILRYTALVEDPALWEPEFESALAFGIASEMALPMTGKGELRAAMLQGRSASLDQAATNTAAGNVRIVETVPDWIAVRG